MPRTIWSGAISFGLVTSLNYTGERLHFSIPCAYG